MGNKMAKSGDNQKLTKKNLKFIELIIKDVKVFEAYKLSGYIGSREAAYQLKHKLKPFIDKYYEIEGLSKDGYKARLLKLLDLPCVDRNNQPVDKLNFNQYIEVLTMLKDSLDRDEDKHKNTNPRITAFIIDRSDGQSSSNKLAKAKVVQGEVVDITNPLGNSKAEA
jgi:hypothetical protein